MIKQLSIAIPISGINTLDVILAAIIPPITAIGIQRGSVFFAFELSDRIGVNEVEGVVVDVGIGIPGLAVEHVRDNTVLG